MEGENTMRGDVYMGNVTKAVIETASLNLRGTLIDNGWFQHLKYLLCIVSIMSTLLHSNVTPCYIWM